MTNRRQLSRREALRGSAVAVGGALFGAIPYTGSVTSSVRANPIGANDRIRLGVIGTGVRGKHLIGNLPDSVQVTAICDCATSRMTETVATDQNYSEILSTFRSRDAERCQQYQDYRELLDRETLDAVIIATPDHHHAQAAMLALDAGLDVYLEKPMTVSIAEGRLLANKVRQTGRILQVGSQQRTMEVNRFACEFIRDGGLGEISRVELPNYPGPIADPNFPAEPVPEGLNWNLFVGPTPMRPHHRKVWVKDDFKVGKLLWRGWDLFRDYSGHLMTNWGAHSVDMMQYALGCDETGPVAIRSHRPNSVAEIAIDWVKKTPQSSDDNDRRFWPVSMDYANGVKAVFRGPNAALTFHGERGVMKIRRNHFEIDRPELIPNGPGPEAAAKWDGGGHVARPHLQNWLDCIRSRNQPNAPVEVGHRSVTVCHLANIARNFDRELTWNPITEQFVNGNQANDDEANEYLSRPRRAGFELT